MEHDHMHHQAGMAHQMSTTTQMPHHHHHHNDEDQLTDVPYNNHLGHDMSHDSNGHGMQMSFFFSEHSTILFSSWTTSSWQGMLGSCIVIFVMAALYEGLKVLREVLLKRSFKFRGRGSDRDSIPVPSDDNHVNITESLQPRRNSYQMLSASHIIQTLLHVLQITISYLLMLIFMTYNVYLCIAVALGAGFGYFLFGWKRKVVTDINEHCH